MKEPGKIMKYLFLTTTAILIVFMMSLSMIGCSEENEDSAVFMTCNMRVKFESPVGTNVVDSLNLVQLEDVDSYTALKRYDYQNDDVVLARCVRESDGREIEFDRQYSYTSLWVRHFEPSPVNPFLIAQGTILELRWTDPYIFKYSEGAPAKEYDQAYTVYLKSPKIFGDDNERTVKWYVHVRKNIYNVYKCEVNGVECDFKDFFGPPYRVDKWNGIAHLVPMQIKP